MQRYVIASNREREREREKDHLKIVFSLTHLDAESKSTHSLTAKNNMSRCLKLLEMMQKKEGEKIDRERCRSLGVGGG